MEEGSVGVQEGPELAFHGELGIQEPGYGLVEFGLRLYKV